MRFAVPKLCAVFFVAALCPAAAISDAKDHEGSVRVVHRCIVETRAAGHFAVDVSSGSIPMVRSVSDAALTHVRNLQDCILDKFSVQFADPISAVNTVTNRPQCTYGTDILQGGSGYRSSS
ncbi:MAG: hypothetical protein AB8B71_09425 [Paracoccaceae bacterium]